MKSKIGKEKLKHIYRICNQDPRIPIMPRVFCVVFHIIQLVRKGFEIPQVLPNELASVMTPSPSKNRKKNLPPQDVKTSKSKKAPPTGTNAEQESARNPSKRKPKPVALKLQPHVRRGKFIFDAA